MTDAPRPHRLLVKEQLWVVAQPFRLGNEAGAPAVDTDGPSPPTHHAGASKTPLFAGATFLDSELAQASSPSSRLTPWRFGPVRILPS